MTKLKIATWNVNSVRLRIGLVGKLLKEHAPDILCLQETKARDEVFPAKALKRRGYDHLALCGQKGYHGVAIVSKLPFERVWSDGFCGKGDARHVAVQVAGVELHDVYVPAGGDVPDPKLNDKFAHKLAFVEELESRFAARRKKAGVKAVLVGDVNIAPLENDVWSHKQLLDVVSHTPAETERLARAMAAFDWTDVTRSFVPPAEKVFTWWSYRNQDWKKSDRGRRLDHMWVSPALRGALSGHRILREARDWARPSDHVPVIAEIEV